MGRSQKSLSNKKRGDCMTLDSTSFNFKDEYEVEDLFIIDKEVPINKIKNNIILITNIESLERFKSLLLGSKEYLSNGFNLHELMNFYTSLNKEIRVLSYAHGIESIKKLENVICFLNEGCEDDYHGELADELYPYILKDSLDSIGIEGFYISKII